MENESILGILVDLEELRKTKRLVLWGRIAQSGKHTSPHVKLLEVPIDWDALNIDKTRGIIFNTYIAFE